MRYAGRRPAPGRALPALPAFALACAVAAGFAGMGVAAPTVAYADALTVNDNSIPTLEEEAAALANGTIPFGEAFVAESQTAYNDAAAYAAADAAATQKEGDAAAGTCTHVSGGSNQPSGVGLKQPN